MKKYIFSLVCLCCALLPALEGQAHEYPNHPELRKSDANIVGHILDKNTKEHLPYITVDPRYAVHRAARQHQQPRAYHYDYQKAGSQNKRRVRTPPQQPYQPVGKAEKGKHQQQDKVIGLAM